MNIVVTVRKHASQLKVGDVIEGQRGNKRIAVRVDRAGMDAQGWVASGTSTDSPGGRRVNVPADVDGYVEAYLPDRDQQALRALVAVGIAEFLDRPVTIRVDGEEMVGPDRDVHPDIAKLADDKPLDEPLDEPEPEPAHGG